MQRLEMPAEVIDFIDLLDVAYNLASELNILTSHTIDLQLFTEKKSLFDSI